MTAEPEIIYDYDPHNLPPEMLRAIGLVVTASSHTEYALQVLLGGLLAVDEIEAFALSKHMAYPLKETIIRSVSELNATDASFVDAVDDLLEEVKGALDKRNIVVHNSIARHPDTNKLYSQRESARGSLQISLEVITVEEIEQIAASIYEVGLKVLRFIAMHSLLPLSRTRAVYAPLDRTKKARAARRKTSE